MDILIVNLETGMPTVDVAIRRLGAELNAAKAMHVKVIKFIHGYGSSGTGGRIRVAVRKELEVWKKNKKIRQYIPGETWEIFNMDAIKLLDACGSLRGDRDLGQYNSGITMVLL